MEKHLYQLPVPIADNNGVQYAPHKNASLRLCARITCGGYTELAPAKGVWESPEHVIYTDNIIPLQFAATEREAQLVVARFFALFPDQKCAMLVKLGAATFHNNPRL